MFRNGQHNQGSNSKLLTLVIFQGKTTTEIFFISIPNLLPKIIV